MAGKLAQIPGRPGGGAGFLPEARDASRPRGRELIIFFFIFIYLFIYGCVGSWFLCEGFL